MARRSLHPASNLPTAAKPSSASGGRHAKPETVEPNAIILPANTADIGSTPRTIGAAYAWGLGADAVAFLDADCYFAPDHLSRLLQFSNKTGKPVVCSGRWIVNHDATLQAPCAEVVPGSGFHDTNTFLFQRDPLAVQLSYTYGCLLTPEEHKVGDRHLSAHAIQAGLLACHYHPTVYYRSTHRFHYVNNGWPVPEGMRLKDLSNSQAQSSRSD